MRYSPVLKSSPHCLPSPDGHCIATVSVSGVNIRDVASLEVVRSIGLPAEVAGSVTTFASSYHATIRNPALSGAKSVFVDFGQNDDEVFVFSALGIKLSIFPLSSSQVVEISNPKCYSPSTVAHGFSFRSQSGHLALLTRTAGKDMISIHSPGTRAVARSWNPDVIDAQGICWAPDGRWLVVWESAAHGIRVLFYTADGNLYRDWTGPQPASPDSIDHGLHAGVKQLAFSHDGRYVAVADYERSLYILSTSNLMQCIELIHPLGSIELQDTLQVWQETDGSLSAFIKASQSVAPPGRASKPSQDLRTGCEYMGFDCSSATIATVLADAPTTVWVWDVAALELRAVLIFHSNVSKVEWHPAQPELLFVKCDGDRSSGLVFVWDPLSDGPRTADFQSHFAGGITNGRVSTFWIKSNPEAPTILLADGTACMLGSLADDDQDVPWKDDSIVGSRDDASDSATESDMDPGDLDDTFHFKRGAGPGK
ncbi:WD40 domain-containing protein [Apiospora kogelbergensis]|uniref:WD40 domain-containing protein n=1 Tax=Apiospora kogelbergensis TaxID=1337665 RepID=UPI00312FD7A7